MGSRKIVLEGYRPISWNKLYAGKHWRYRKLQADIAHGLVRLAIGNEPDIIESRVDIEVVVYFDKYPYDPCNIPAKLVIDGLLGIWLVDDNPKYVRSVTTRSEVDKDHPRLEMKVNWNE